MLKIIETIGRLQSQRYKPAKGLSGNLDTLGDGKSLSRQPEGDMLRANRRGDGANGSYYNKRRNDGSAYNDYLKSLQS